MNTRTDTPAPLRRRGPRPLLLHLTLAMLRSTVSRATSPSSKPASPNLSTAFAEATAAIAAALRDPVHADSAAEAFPRAVLEATLRQDADLIERHRRLPPPSLAPRPARPAGDWAEGETPPAGLRRPDRGHGVPALFVPSLVNRAYVLDLAPGHSMLRWLAGQGVRPLLLDWGWPRRSSGASP